MRDVLVDSNQMEEIRHKLYDFPLRIDYGNINEFLNRQVRCHWHREVEFLYVHAGCMGCKVNDDAFLLSAGEGVFINGNSLHMSWAIDDEECVYSSIAVQPSLFGQEHSSVRRKYVDTILSSHSLGSFHFTPREPWQAEVLAAIGRLDHISRVEQPECFEMESFGELLRAWSIFYRNIKGQLGEAGAPSAQVKVLKTMLAYLQEHYTEHLTLDQIARSAGISKSGCSHIFKSYMQKTPFEYLMRFRVEKSLPLLLSEDANITETALSTGFSSSSYYSEVFRRFMGISPQQYRKTVKGEAGAAGGQPQ